MNRTDRASKTKIFAVAGNPVLHSRSPEIFNAAFKARAFSAVYTRIAASNAEEIIECARETGMAGMNITSPFKEEIMKFLDDVDGGAKRIGAVNTVVMKHGRYGGYNTDVAGVVNAFLAADVRLTGRKAAVIGAGGAAKAAIFALLSEGAEVLIFNRTFEKAKVLSEALGCKAARFEDINGELIDMDIIISCLPVSGRILKPDLLKEGIAVLDANYSMESPLVKDAKERGCKVIDGREWLLFQGAEAFKHFTGLEPPLPTMRRALYTQRPTHKRNIALVGFMGTGKTTVAYGISKGTDMPAIDIDKEIEQKAGSSISEIFESKGEDAFRKMERKEMGNIPDISKAVISCGGGVVLSKKNIDILKKNCVVVWLWAGIDAVLKRAGNNGTRPLLSGRHGKSAIKRLLDARLPLYACASDMIVRTDGAEPDEIARKIYGETDKFLKN